MNQNEVQIGANYLGKFDDKGVLVDQTAKDAINGQVASFIDWITFIKAGARAV